MNGLRFAWVRCCLIWLLVLWQLPAMAQAQKPAPGPRDQISERAWLDDPSNSLGPEQVRDRDWTPYKGPLRRGFQSSTTWLRLKVEPLADAGRRSADREGRLVLRILPGHLDEIALFDPRRPDQPPLLTGDTQDWRKAEYRSFNQSLVIDTPAESVEILLRLRTTSHHGIHVEALRWDDVEAIDRQQQLLYGAVIMFLVMVLAWAVVAWLERRDRVIGAFAVHQLISILFSAILFGFARVYLSGLLPPNAIDTLSSVSFPITATAVLWFHWHLLREFSPPRLGMRCLGWLTVITPITLLFIPAGLTRLTLQITLLTTLIYPLLLLVLAALSRPRTLAEPPTLSRRALIVAYSLNLIVLWNATLPALALLPSPPWTLYSATAYGVISALILLSILRSRERHQDIARNESQTQLALAAQSIEQEKAMRRDQEQFITMLTHELTNALATAHLAIGGLDPSSPMRARGYRAIDSIRSIIQRCVSSGEYETAAPVLQVERLDVQSLVRELMEQSNGGSDIILTSDSELPKVTTDRKLLGIVLGNLIDNALKYRARASQITVQITSELRGTRGGIQVAVTNQPGETGPPDPERAFRKYWRGPGASRAAGSGLGLYLSSLIATRLDSDLQCHVDPTHVRFVLWLPI
jgi:signal transduction histidine kinase